MTTCLETIKITFTKIQVNTYNQRNTILDLFFSVILYYNIKTWLMFQRNITSDVCIYTGRHVA